MTPTEAFARCAPPAFSISKPTGWARIAGADPEYLHQMRVALRRLRTAFDIFADAAPDAAGLDGELRWLSRALERARDWDVFVADTLKPMLSGRRAMPACALCGKHARS